MAEYAVLYYEFLAIDRPLTTRDMDVLRSFSSRGRITPTSFTNDYSYGSFKGDPVQWMETYFDAFLYYANWGSRTLMLRLPKEALAAETLELYCCSEYVWSRATTKHLIVGFQIEAEEDVDVEDEPQLASFVPLRSDICRGDNRALYLGWLLAAQSGHLDDHDREPPVPPGLKTLTAALVAFTDFFAIDSDLLAVASAFSTSYEAAERPSDIRKFVAKLTASERDDYLRRLIEQEPNLAVQLQRRAAKISSRRPTISPEERGRTAGELLRAADVQRKERQRTEAERKSAESARPRSTRIPRK